MNSEQIKRKKELLNKIKAKKGKNRHQQPQKRPLDGEQDLK